MLYIKIKIDKNIYNNSIQMDNILSYYEQNKDELNKHNSDKIDKLLSIIKNIESNKQLEIYNYYEQLIKIYDKIINIKYLSEIDSFIECYDNLSKINIDKEKDLHIQLSLIYLDNLVQIINEYSIQKVFLSYALQPYHISILGEIYKLFCQSKKKGIKHASWIDVNILRIFNSEKSYIFYYDDSKGLFFSANEDIGKHTIDSFKVYLKKILD